MNIKNVSQTHPGGMTVVASFAIFIVICAVAFGAFYILNVYQNTSVVNSDTNTSFIDTAVTPVTEQLAAQAKLKKFANENDLTAFLEDRAGSSSNTSYINTTGIMEDVMQTSPSAAPTDTLGLGASEETKSSTSSSDDYSKTNVQVEGVDEGDIVKTDGSYIYTVVGTTVEIVKVGSDNSLSIESTIAIDGYPQNMYINGSRLVVYGTDTSYSTEPYYDLLPRSNSSFTFVKIFDVSDHAKPEKIRDLRFEGNYVDSRMIGDYIYMVTSNPTYQIMTNPIPLMVEDGTVKSFDMSTGGVYYLDGSYDNYSFTRVNAIPVLNDNEDVSAQVYLLSSTEQMYVSETAMYLTYTKYVSEQQIQLEALRSVVEPKLSAADKQKIKDIQDAPAHVLSYYDKQQKMYQVFAIYVEQLSASEQTKIEADIEAYVTKKYKDISKELEKTVIQKVQISGSKLTLGATGEVTGHVLNQFSMDESGGYFRIATTKSSTWSQFAQETDSYNNLYILDGDLKQVGKAEDLAKGEQIYSVRFMQNRAYIVTFKQTDPLFVLDVSNPQSPKVLGELKVPGFSSYLHPYDDTTLIGFGKEADENGRTKGLKISLFNVADPANLKETATYTIGDAGSDSIALYDHKAFLFSKEKNLLVIPATVYESTDGSYYGSVTSNGAMVFNITPTSIELRKTISHVDTTKNDAKVYDSYMGYTYYDSSVKRSLYIGKNLYTISDQFIKVNDLETLTEQQSLALTS
ncbi:MAG: beta-propeller domain-containing protein [Patescibacteria group bacterium]|jgi:uncharacterized secreted protein with C-terminal beta-propeller domain